MVEAVLLSVSPENIEETSPDLSKVPTKYHDLKEVFNKVKATSLLSHRPYDCAFDLISGTMPPRGSFYSLSGPEHAIMQNYVKESLQASIIRPSASPGGAGFFFVKDDALRPCIDYRGFNKITIKNKYPLPLMSSVFDFIQGATVFTKLDLKKCLSPGPYQRRE